MLSFISALYNEENEVDDLLDHVEPYVDSFYLVDDGSTDGTFRKLLDRTIKSGVSTRYYLGQVDHTGLPETVKHLAKEMVPEGHWVLMLDADERLHPETLKKIRTFVDSEESEEWDYVYFNQLEIIDGVHVRTFQKCKLFRREAISFPLNNIHADDQFTGRGTYKEDWLVFHRKTSDKQKQREREYLETYKTLLDEGHIDWGRYEWLKGLHHFEKE